MPDHDYGYKLLFSHPQMVRDLLEGFVREDWLAELDYDSLERINSSYIADDLRERADDVVWRVRWGDGWVYINLLIEFQSTIERFMAVRILTYVGLLYQDLIRGKRLASDRCLPPVLPIVLYNGDRRWSAPDNLVPLIQAGSPRALRRYLPEARYLLIDEGRYRTGELSRLRNLVAALFRLENSRNPDDAHAVVRSLGEWLKGPEQASLRRAFAVWIDKVILARRLGGTATNVEDLQEMTTLLDVKGKQWKRNAEKEGRREGRREGLRKGEALVLKRLLSKRFGDLPDWAQIRLTKAVQEDLEKWVDRVLEIDRLEALFDNE